MKSSAAELEAVQSVEATRGGSVSVSLLTACRDRPYVYGLVMALLARPIRVDLIGSDDIDSPDFHTSPRLAFLNFGGKQGLRDGVSKKLSRTASYYARLIRYALSAKPKIFHILWNYKLEYIDRILLTLFYKLLGKRIVLTLHNVNAGIRDSNDSYLNRRTLRFQYHRADHIFVHTAKMKQELIDGFGVTPAMVTVIPFGINNSVPVTDVSGAEARQLLGLPQGAEIILFFGNIGPYKGLEYLVAAFQRVAERNPNIWLVIAGKTRGGAEQYLADIQREIGGHPSGERILQKIQFVRDEETELYFKAADVLVLPYTQVFQSGVLFLGYNFGLPVVASDVGSLREDILEGKTGFLARPGDPDDLSRAIETYFGSDLYKNLARRRQEIRDFAHASHSWQSVAEITERVYTGLLRSDHHEAIGINSHSSV